MVKIKSKKGLTGLLQVFFVFLIFFFIMYIGVQAYAVIQIDNLLSSVDFKIGDVSFNETYNNTMALALDSIVDNSDNAGMILIFGMIVVMLIIGFSFSTNRLWMVFDWFVIVVAFIIAVFLSRAFDTFIHTTPEILSIFSTELENSSRFMLNLPFVVIIVGLLVMILTYAILRKKEQFFGG